MEALSALSDIRARMAKAAEGAGEADPQLVAVSKTKSVDQMLALYAEGQRVFGENYVQELAEKSAELQARNIRDFEFHFIGHLQSNKVKTILPLVTTIHSVDSFKLFEEIEKRAKALGKAVSVYFQVNIDGEDSKSGFRPEELSGLAKAISERAPAHAVPAGLMAIPNPDLNTAKAFAEMKRLSAENAAVLGTGLSMGMSDDFESAIQNGATLIRIGTALFGTRE